MEHTINLLQKDLLENYNRAQLKTIADHLGIATNVNKERMAREIATFNYMEHGHQSANLPRGGDNSQFLNSKFLQDSKNQLESYQTQTKEMTDKFNFILSKFSDILQAEETEFRGLLQPYAQLLEKLNKCTAECNKDANDVFGTQYQQDKNKFTIVNVTPKIPPKRVSKVPMLKPTKESPQPSPMKPMESPPVSPKASPMKPMESPPVTPQPTDFPSVIQELPPKVMPKTIPQKPWGMKLGGPKLPTAVFETSPKFPKQVPKPKYVACETDSDCEDARLRGLISDCSKQKVVCVTKKSGTKECYYEAKKLD